MNINTDKHSLITSEYNNYGMQIAKEEKKRATVNRKTGRFDNRDSAAIISNASKAVGLPFFHFCTALLTLLMMTAESVSKCPVLRFGVAVLFLFSLSLHRFE